MLKENGRVKKTARKETSKQRGKTFDCPKCKASKTLHNVEFGEAVYCLSCDSKMNEMV